MNDLTAAWMNRGVSPDDPRWEKHVARFRAKQIINGPDECYGWAGNIDPAGYARNGGSTIFGTPYAHLIAFKLAGGICHAGYEVDHACHTRDASCVGLGSACPHRQCTREDHLIAMPLKANRQARHVELVTECPAKHPLDEKNTYTNPRTGSRSCRECLREANRISHAKYKDLRNAQRDARRGKMGRLETFGQLDDKRRRRAT
jgi:hypothetical protein